MSRAGNGGLLTLRQLLERGHLRLILFAVVLAWASMTLGGILLAAGNMHRNLQLVAQTMSYTAEPALVFGDTEALETGIATLAAQGNLDHVQVIDAGGKVLGQWSRKSDGILDPLVKAIDAMGWLDPAAVEVRRGGQYLATLTVYGSSSPILGFAARGLLIGLCAFGLAILATRILARRLEDEILLPIQHVAQVAHAVRVDRDFNQRVGHSGILEVDRFAADFNALLTELEGWHTSLTSQNETLAHRAMHDPLTRLGNRDLFQQSLETSVINSTTDGTFFAILFMDMDGFKQINDKFGHAAGDSVLVVIAKRLRQCIRSNDRAFRLGGDEFAVILDPLADNSLVKTVTARINALVVRPIELECGTVLKVSVSIGSAIYPQDGFDSKAILRFADERMYRSKRLRFGSRSQGGEVDHG